MRNRAGSVAIDFFRNFYLYFLLYFLFLPDRDIRETLFFTVFISLWFSLIQKYMDKLMVVVIDRVVKPIAGDRGLK